MAGARGCRLGIAPEQYETYLKEAALKLYGHIIRREVIDPLRQATFVGNSIKKVIPYKRKVGRPTYKWQDMCAREAWEKTCKHEHSNAEFNNSLEQLELIKQKALLKLI